ncbi:class I SAM-dependent methyltransferase [Marinospirillum perlucidum]|uniref:class I SAM-dependent methyltransferase n=1 Tax=Marinospirillum perlucidum TaxID=1982602 RepID=UPI000DF3C78C|nr:methyltransferase domain-containing protein [Marinospirillum perlucidum]
MSVQKQQAQVNRDTWNTWQHFWQSPLGREVLGSEEALLQPLVEAARGYHLLLIGSCPGGGWIETTRIGQVIEWRPSLDLAEKESCVLADPAALPFPDDCMDLVILQHSLELFARPHALLKEAARVTLPKGELVILAFNPISLWGLTRLLPAFLQPEPLRLLKQADLISQAKMDDWLEFLDLNKEASYQLFHRPPCNRDALQQRLRSWDRKQDQRSWPLAGVYMLRIKKRIGSPLRPQPAWKKTGWMPAQPVSFPTRNSLKNR